MEIHKSKPWHGARELAKEIGVIVIGVLIALGGQQAVQSLDRHVEADECPPDAEIGDCGERAPSSLQP